MASPDEVHHPGRDRRRKPGARFHARQRRGEKVKLSALRGKPVVLYFYPKDDTPGCTRQACGIRDSWAEFQRAGAEVFGISADTTASHERFRSKYSLPFTLLADPEHKLAEPYGVGQEGKNSYERSTFVIDADGNVARIMRRVNPDRHADDVLAGARRLALAHHERGLPDDRAVRALRQRPHARPDVPRVVAAPSAESGGRWYVHARPSGSVRRAATRSRPCGCRDRAGRCSSAPPGTRRQRRVGGAPRVHDCAFARARQERRRRDDEHGTAGPRRSPPCRSSRPCSGGRRPLSNFALA